jgi:hypothetical protein
MRDWPVDDIVRQLPPRRREHDGRERLDLLTLASDIGVATLIVRTHPGNGHMLLAIEAKESRAC